MAIYIELPVVGTNPEGSVDHALVFPFPNGFNQNHDVLIVDSFCWAVGGSMSVVAEFYASDYAVYDVTSPAFMFLAIGDSYSQVEQVPVNLFRKPVISYGYVFCKARTTGVGSAVLTLKCRLKSSEPFAALTTFNQAVYEDSA